MSLLLSQRCTMYEGREENRVEGGVDDIMLSRRLSNLSDHLFAAPTHHTPQIYHSSFALLCTYVTLTLITSLVHTYILLILDCFTIVTPTFLSSFLPLLTTCTSTHIDTVFPNTNNFTSVGFRRETATLIFLVI